MTEPFGARFHHSIKRVCVTGVADVALNRSSNPVFKNALRTFNRPNYSGRKGGLLHRGTLTDDRLGGCVGFPWGKSAGHKVSDRIAIFVADPDIEAGFYLRAWPPLVTGFVTLSRLAVIPFLANEQRRRSLITQTLQRQSRL